ncbi:MAG: hypothetical protein RIQ79_2598 [Verrucomicrobiota bacterium]
METNPPAFAPTFATSAPASNDKLLAVLCHLSGFLGVALLLPLIIYLVTKPEAAYVRDNAREALNCHLSLVLYAIACLPLVMIIIGVPLLIALGIGGFVFAILAAIKASDGGCYRYPMCIRFVN